MSVGPLPNSGGQLHVGPVDCTACRAETAGATGEPTQSLEHLGELSTNVDDFDDYGVPRDQYQILS